MAELQKSKYKLEPNGFKISFANYPSTKVYKDTTGSSWKEHLLFGDYVKILNTEIKNGRVNCRCRGATGWIRKNDLQKERVLEVNFVDIGQGDGCHIVTPDDQHIIVDAGENDNMIRYLAWRFNLAGKRNPLPFPFIIIISHSDKDHYKGFAHVFKNKVLPVSHIYHNGIVERPGEDHPFGKLDASKKYITTLVTDTAGMKAIITDPTKIVGTSSMYPKTLKKVLRYNPNVQFKMLSADDKFIDGFSDVNNKKLSFELLGPVIEEKNGKKVLRFFSNVGKAKNGQSVIFKLNYGKARILLGGDLNEEAGEYLVKHYSNDLEKLEVDVAKACHHGSPHFFYDFIKHVNASATVISSGDNEGYAHPRPDAIGALGKCGYGKRPLIFSTELARSNKDINSGNLLKIHKIQKSIETFEKEIKLLKAAGNKEEEIKKFNTKITKKNKMLNSFLTRYGTINLRTDGDRMIIAQKYEKNTSHGKWDIHQLEYDSIKHRFVRVEH